MGCIAAVIGSVIQASSYSVAQLIVGRIATVSKLQDVPRWFTHNYAGFCYWMYFEVGLTIMTEQET